VWILERMSMTLKGLVKGKKVRFRFYRDGELWYATDDGFEFPVPITDTGTGVFQAEGGAIQYMRWIRKHLERRAEWEKEAGAGMQYSADCSAVIGLIAGRRFGPGMPTSCRASTSPCLKSSKRHYSIRFEVVIAKLHDGRPPAGNL